MKSSAKIYVAGHNGLVGSALVRRLSAVGYSNLVARSHRDLDLRERKDFRELLQAEHPEYIFIVAARVGGILANSTYPAEFITQKSPDPDQYYS
jgi:GDP-L-fucose synthase